MGTRSVRPLWARPHGAECACLQAGLLSWGAGEVCGVHAACSILFWGRPGARRTQLAEGSLLWSLVERCLASTVLGGPRPDLLSWGGWHSLPESQPERAAHLAERLLGFCLSCRNVPGCPGPAHGACWEQVPLWAPPTLSPETLACACLPRCPPRLRTSRLLRPHPGVTLQAVPGSTLCGADATLLPPHTPAGTPVRAPVLPAPAPARPMPRAGPRAALRPSNTVTGLGRLLRHEPSFFSSGTSHIAPEPWGQVCPPLQPVGRACCSPARWPVVLADGRSAADCCWATCKFRVSGL